ncbi:MAG: EVE domain-containing protein [Candidatus Njordarchaeia archaeon]
MTTWFCILTPENFEVVKKKLIWGVEDRHKKVIDQVKKGDKLVMYVIGEKKIRGIYEAAGNPFRDEKKLFKSKVYPNRVKLKKVKEGEIEIDKIRDKMDLFKGLGPRWALKLRGRAMIEISNNDYKLIEKSF